MRQFKKAFYLLILVLCLPLLAWAVTETGTGTNIVAEVIPQEPAPGGMVSISLTGFGFDNENARYDWYQDGILKISSIGNKKYSFQLGQLGKPTRIKVSVFYNQRHLADKSFYFEPSDISFSWQANTLTPPFYQGKARASAGASLKVLATPFLTNQLGQVLKTNDLIYSWYIDETLNKEISGKGKNIVSISTGPKDSQIKISLKISSADGKSRASKSLVIYLSKPEIAFYEQVPLEGTNYKKEIVDTYELYGEEARFIAIPFFWPLDSLDNANYAWRVNSLSSPKTETPNILTVRQPSGGTGINEINLQISSGVSTNNSINNRFNIKFGNNLLKTYNAI
ncbi:MAG: hypothetical protein WCV68_02890 [Candidatus Paceibacterota bacterium]|jgi:hypothetical protein